MKRNKQGKQPPGLGLKRKISTMLWEFAGEFIEQGETPEEMQNRLTASCCAWNIASVPAEQRPRLLAAYMSGYLQYSPSIDPVEAAAIRSDIEQLVERKLQKFPADLRQLVSAHVVPMGDQVRIDAVAATVE